MLDVLGIKENILLEHVELEKLSGYLKYSEDFF